MTEPYVPQGWERVEVPFIGWCISRTAGEALVWRSGDEWRISLGGCDQLTAGSLTLAVRIAELWDDAEATEFEVDDDEGAGHPC